THPRGLLPLTSPPGFGQTSLMEFVAGRLGLVLVQVDGPSLGSAVPSFAPAAAPNPPPPREGGKINSGWEGGNNTLFSLGD
uniref:hypothetical protein n=1 Tax=Streptomyces sp. GbtcB7 TaxID=2824752 RepID=UPI001C2F22C0